MKYAIISDIHGNLEALTNVLAICEQEQVEHYVCLGDVVGYNANPKECLDIVRALPNLTIVKGNHDEYASNGDNVMEGFKPPCSGPAPSSPKRISAGSRLFRCA